MTGIFFTVITIENSRDSRSKYLEWINENIGGRFKSMVHDYVHLDKVVKSRYSITFYKEEDAAAFKLRWANET